MRALTLIVLGLWMGWAAPPVRGQSPSPLPLTVANYQIQPTDPKGEMIPYLNQRFGIRLQVISLENQRFQEQLNLRIAEGQVPDFLYLRQATLLGTYARLGVLAPLPEATLRKEAPHLVRRLEEEFPGALDLGKVEGVLYGVPVLSGTNRFHIPLVYRRDWMDRLGVKKAPDTLAEFEALMYRFAHDDPDGNGKKDTWGLSKDGLTAVFGAFGLVPWDEKTDYWTWDQGRPMNHCLSPQAKEALALLARWYKDGVIDPEFLTGENKGGYWAISHSFVEGRIGFTTHGNYYHWITRGAFVELNEEGKPFPVEAQVNGRELERTQPQAKLTFGPPLKGPTGQRGIKEFNRLMNFVTVGRPAASVPGKVETIFRIWDASASPSLVDRLTLQHGQQGRHWKLLNAATETVQILPPFNTEVGYQHRIGLVLDLDVPSPVLAPREQWAQSLGLDRDGIRSIVQVGLPTMMRHDLVLKNLRNQAYIAIVTGAKPVSSFDRFVQEYRAAGGSEVQREVEAYLRGQKPR